MTTRESFPSHEPVHDRAEKPSGSPHTETHLAKRRVRADVLAARAARRAEDADGRQRERLAAQWAGIIGNLVDAEAPAGATVAAFLPTGVEPPILRALTEVHAAGYRVVVPISLPAHRLDWAEWAPDVELVTTPFGVSEPTGPRLGTQAFDRADLRLVPALAVDALGTRLGYGGGYYDAALARAASAPTLGVVFHDEWWPAGRVPAEDHDARLAMVCTERGVFEVGDARGRGSDD